MRRIDVCITQLQAESNKEEEGKVWGDRAFSRVVGRLDTKEDVWIGGWKRYSATAR